MTIAPRFSQLPRTRLGTPAADITISATRVTSSGLFVKAWTTLTVAWCLCQDLQFIILTRIMEIFELLCHTCNSKVVGNPTTLLRPITATFFPFSLIPDRSSNSIQAFAAQGMNRGSLPLKARFPIFNGWKPSTSFCRLTAPKIVSSSMCCTQFEQH